MPVEQTEQVHEDREEERRDGEQDGDDDRPAHDVAEQTHGQGKRGQTSLTMLNGNMIHVGFRQDLR